MKPELVFWGVLLFTLGANYGLLVYLLGLAHPGIRGIILFLTVAFMCGYGGFTVGFGFGE